MLALPYIIYPLSKGLLLAAVPGPITFEMIHQGVTKNSFHAFLIRLGANLSTLCILTVTLIASYLSADLAHTLTYQIIAGVLSGFGSLFIMVKGFKQLYSPIEQQKTQPKSASAGTLFIGMSFGIANPIVWFSWIALFQYSATQEHISLTQQGLDGLLIIGGMTLWGLLLARALKYVQHSHILRLIARLSGAFLFIMGFMMFYYLIQQYI